MTKAIIGIERDSGYADKLRNYQVQLDGRVIGVIADGQNKSFNVEPGSHTLRIKIDWGGSQKQEFQIAANQMIRFKCASKARGNKIWLSIFYATILSQRYIKLERVD